MTNCVLRAPVQFRQRRLKFAIGPIASFRCAAEFGRYRGIADSGKPSAGRFMGSRPRSFCVGPRRVDVCGLRRKRDARRRLCRNAILGFEELYTDVIQPLVTEFGLRPYRADQIYGPGTIIDDIIRGIETAQIVIAEITPTNENVFYEVGYAHALKKPTILLVDREKKEKLPFDLSGFRCLFYQNSIGGKGKVKEGLRRHLEAILNE
jgi:Nucleoside 2-deoxyribosyltransferase